MVIAFFVFLCIALAIIYFCKHRKQKNRAAQINLPLQPVPQSNVISPNIEGIVYRNQDRLETMIENMTNLQEAMRNLRYLMPDRNAGERQGFSPPHGVQRGSAPSPLQEVLTS